MRSVDRNRALAAAILFAATPALAAAGPFSVRRASRPGDAAAAPPAAVVDRAPFDDAGAFADPADAFIVVTDSSGARVPVSVMRVPSLGILRIGFDDGDPSSAPVDAARSEVALDRGSIPADGLTVATVTVRPEDASGILLGTGLSVSIDPAPLWPGRVIGAVEDVGDGSYLGRIVSTVPGIAEVRVRVEATALAVRPTIEFAAVESSSGSPRDVAIAMLRDLTRPEGLFEALAALDARDAIERALSDLEAGGARDDNALKGGIAAALESLKDPELVRAVLEASRRLAIHQVVLAEGACGACDAERRDPKQVCDAWDLFAKGDRLARSEPPDAPAAAEAWAQSVARSLQAQQHCL